jgi:hypothetical protein
MIAEPAQRYSLTGFRDHEGLFARGRAWLINTPGKPGLMTISGRMAALVLLALGAALFFLIGPVIGQALMGAFEAQAERFAPRLFLVGLGVLITGLVIGIQLVAVAGGCLMGAVLLAALLKHY